jgi:hypothetical protein
MNEQKGKRGQVTIFIIIAIVIVALIVITFLLFPQIRVNFGFGSDNPNEFMQNCMEDEIKGTINLISSQGGSVSPENYILYQDEKIEYLCYTNEFYIPCVVQRPILKQHIESEIKDKIKDKSEECFESLKSGFESKGFDVSLQPGVTEVELFPRTVFVNYNRTLTLTKDNTQRFEKVEVSVRNTLYELMSIANSIIDSETEFGDSETTIYMNYYHDLKVEKKKQSDGTTIYILTDRRTNDKFQFASRSVAWPPGTQFIQ